MWDSGGATDCDQELELMEENQTAAQELEPFLPLAQKPIAPLSVGTWGADEPFAGRL